ncbi:hypothetical protein SDC9_169558 [bioreactor metagenome]|uniref:Uncharacterized protein n=1 Tax=bioreactor metagenome TaxID=1076179 RepID=A0A645G691_9ZZZZ
MHVKARFAAHRRRARGLVVLDYLIKSARSGAGKRIHDRGVVSFKDTAGLYDGGLWSNNAVRPYFQREAVIIGTLPHTLVLDVVLHTLHRRKQGVCLKRVHRQV